MCSSFKSQEKFIKYVTALLFILNMLSRVCLPKNNLFDPVVFDGKY